MSQLVADYFAALTTADVVAEPRALPPLARSLRGSLAGHDVDEGDYRRHLEEKFR